MRTITLSVSILSFLFLGIGCSGFLDEDLQGTYSNSTFYKTADHAELALTAVYNMTSFATPNNNIWVFADVASDDAIKGGNPGDQSNIQFIEDFTYFPSNPYLETLWKHHYEGIIRANYLLFHLPDIEMPEERRSEILGETLFLRAYFYFQLVNVYGEVPLKLDPPLTKDQVHVPLSTVPQIYAQLDEDLTEAAAALPAVNTGRVTKGAALGLLAKVRLFQGDYPGTLAAISAIEDLGIYSLVPNYRDNFSLGRQSNTEVLMEVQHLPGGNSKLGSSLNQWFAPQTEGGYYFNNPVQSFVDEFEVTFGGFVDPRLDYSVGREGQLWLNGEPFDPQWSPTGYINKKHLQPLAEVPKATKGDGGLSYIYLRYADVLLMKAEALNESGSTALALEPLNEVRKRARESYLYDESLPGFGSIPADLLPDVTSTNQSVVRSAIQHERRVELGLEFHRFFDLMRYGKEDAESALSDTEFSYETHRYFAIPLSERDINNAID